MRLYDYLCTGGIRMFCLLHQIQLDLANYYRVFAIIRHVRLYVVKKYDCKVFT